MTDKVQKIREEIEKIKTVHSSVGLKESNPDILVVQVCTNLLSFIDSLQEESVSKDLNKAEEFIQNYTKNCSNEILSPYPQINNDIRRIDGEPEKEYSPWLTPDQARRAVEIARKEVIEETVDWLTKHAKKYYFNKDRYLGTDELVEDYKLIMSMNYE